MFEEQYSALFDPRSPYIDYFNSVHGKGAKPVPRSDDELAAAIEDTDLVLLFRSEGSMRRFPYGLEDVVDELVAPFDSGSLANAPSK